MHIPYTHYLEHDRYAVVGSQEMFLRALEMAVLQLKECAAALSQRRQPCSGRVAAMNVAWPDVAPAARFGQALSESANTRETRCFR
jgi:hypothetical protein